MGFNLGVSRNSDCHFIYVWKVWSWSGENPAFVDFTESCRWLRAPVHFQTLVKSFVPNQIDTFAIASDERFVAFDVGTVSSVSIQKSFALLLSGKKVPNK